jgi:MFS transporter (putative signal transducer)
VLFASLYLSEGAPIGFLWLALPTQLRSEGVSVPQISALTSLLVLPWTLKFLWAPLIDVLQTARWTFRHWIISAQVVMGASLLSLLWLDPRRDYGWLTATLVLHAFAAATQDVSIDAFCIGHSESGERGQLNGWMQAGMLI